MAPLNITQDAMRKVLAFFNVVPDFLSALFVCAECPQASDAASGGFRFSSPDGGMSGEYMCMNAACEMLMHGILCNRGELCTQVRRRKWQIAGTSVVDSSICGVSSDCR